MSENPATLEQTVANIQSAVFNDEDGTDNVDDVRVAANTMFVLFSGYLVFLMQAGFAMLTAGSVRSKNTKNVLLKNVLDACVGAIAYWIFGYAFAYGNSGNRFIGWGNFALSKKNIDGTDFTSFFFQWAFAATATTIVSGSVAERTSFYAYMAYAFFLTSFVYPVVSHWIWYKNAEGNWSGFLKSLYGEDGGVVDFAGCTVVHMVGGFAGLVGAIIVGPRHGRFDSEGNVLPIPGHSATLASLGTFLLWFGWYGFNPGSALAIVGKQWAVVNRCAVNTTLAAASGGVITLIVLKLRDHLFDLLGCLNGILAGLVAITASCAFVDPWAAVIIGAVGACIYISVSALLFKFMIDDPLEAFPVHGGSGVWGALAAGLFSRRTHMELAGFNGVHGAFFGGGGKLLGANLLAIVIVAVWTSVLIGMLFFVMKMAGILRISPDEELIGNDVSKHGGVAYPIDRNLIADKADSIGMDDYLKQEQDV